VAVEIEIEFGPRAGIAVQLRNAREGMQRRARLVGFAEFGVLAGWPHLSRVCDQTAVIAITHIRSGESWYVAEGKRCVVVVMVANFEDV
jgi:hypothetical protein